MPLVPNNRLLNLSLIDNGDGTYSQQVVVTGGGSVPEGILSGVVYDDVQVTYPTLTTENYDFYLATVLVATIVLTYAAADKINLTRAQRTL